MGIGGGLRRRLAKASKNLLRRAGFELSRVGSPSDVRVGVKASLPQLRAIAETVPGMITTQEGEGLYRLAFAQSLRGDVIEIGAWQGRSTTFLAAACRDSSNGQVHSIDHFEGNPGKAKHYVVARDDLGDLRTGFISNIERAGLGSWVELHVGRSEEVIEAVRAAAQRPRMIFIDGSHEYQDVRTDLSMYAPLLVEGGLLVLDDHRSQFPGVVAAAREFLDANSEFCCPVQTSAMLMLKRGLDA